MPLRIGPSPVFVVECVTSARRWQMYALRTGVVVVLFFALWLGWNRVVGPRRGPMSYKDYAAVGEAFYFAVIGTQLALVLLAAPGAAAGAICIDKLCGNLLHLFVTDLSDSEVVLGKLASRLAPVAGLIVVSLPVLMIASLLGGLNPEAVVAAYIVMAGTGLAGCALALLLSVWGRKPHEVLLVTYLVEVAWLMAYAVWLAADVEVFHTGHAADWLKNLNPYILIYAPYAQARGVEWSDYGLFAAAAVLVAVVCTLLAVVTVRTCTLREGAVTAKPRRVTRKPRDVLLLDRDPVLWYERHRHRPSRWTRIAWRCFTFAAVGGSVLTVVALVRGHRVDGMATVVNLLQAPIGVLFVLVGAVTALADERIRGGLDVLLTTPVSSAAIVRAKWRAAVRPVPWLTALPAAICVATALYQRSAEAWILAMVVMCLSLAYGLFAASFGLLVATVVPRVGRAIGVAVGVFAVQCLGWPMMVRLLFETYGDEWIGLTLISPIFGCGALTEFQFHRGVGDRFALCSVWGMIWVVLLLLAAGLCYALILAVFDRCLGRVPEGGAQWRDPAIRRSARYNSRTSPAAVESS
ncbi:MAG: ABC transporter permease subunit [Gemmataceae bacterium]